MPPVWRRKSGRSRRARDAGDAGRCYPAPASRSGASSEVRAGELAHGSLVGERDHRSLGAGVEHRVDLLRHGARHHAQLRVSSFTARTCAASEPRADARRRRARAPAGSTARPRRRSRSPAAPAAAGEGRVANRQWCLRRTLAAQSALISAIPSSARRPRPANSAPRKRNSSSCQPTPIPRSTAPPESAERRHLLGDVVRAVERQQDDRRAELDPLASSRRSSSASRTGRRCGRSGRLPRGRRRCARSPRPTRTRAPRRRPTMRRIAAGEEASP